MSTAFTEPIDIQGMILRLQPDARFHWKGGILGVYADVGEWRTPSIQQPTETQVYAEWDVYLIEKAQEDTLIASDIAKITAAKVKAKAIPNWATWNETTALGWFDPKLNDATVDAISSLAAAKPILKDLITVNRALIRMVIALRDNTWPDLDR